MWSLFFFLLTALSLPLPHYPSLFSFFTPVLRRCTIGPCPTAARAWAVAVGCGGRPPEPRTRFLPWLWERGDACLRGSLGPAAGGGAPPLPMGDRVRWKRVAYSVRSMGLHVSACRRGPAPPRRADSTPEDCRGSSLLPSSSGPGLADGLVRSGGTSDFWELPPK